MNFLSIFDRFFCHFLTDFSVIFWHNFLCHFFLTEFFLSFFCQKIWKKQFCLSFLNFLIFLSFFDRIFCHFLTEFSVIFWGGKFLSFWKSKKWQNLKSFLFIFSKNDRNLEHYGGRTTLAHPTFGSKVKPPIFFIYIISYIFIFHTQRVYI